MGIPVRLDVTFIFVPLTLFWAMPDHLYVLMWPATAVATLGVFLSVLVHELGHALAAKRQQVGVAEIVVGGFFGYAALKRQAVFRAQHLRILLAGPLANLAIFLVLWLGLSMAETGGSGAGPFGVPAAQEAAWLYEALRLLALVNLVMFAFNSVPAYPLDGGKILALLLDHRLPPRTSLRIVSLLGIVAGAIMIFLGLGLGLFLTFVGILVVATNVKRLKGRLGSYSAG